MAREDLVNRRVKNLSLSKENAKWLEDCSKKTEIPQGRLLDMAIELLKKEKKLIVPVEYTL